jgi:hypothetical protein
LRAAIRAAPFPSLVDLSCDNEDQVHCDTDTNNWDRIDQACSQKEGNLQFGCQFRLTSRTLYELSAQQTNANSGSKTTQTHHNGGSYVD